MQKLFIILSFFCCWASLTAMGQTIVPGVATPPPVPVRNILSNDQHKVNQRKDSLLSAVPRFIGKGKSITSPAPAVSGKDSSAHGSTRKIAQAAANTEPDPEPMVPSLDRGSCKGIILIEKPRAFEKITVSKEPAPVARPLPVPPQHIPFLQVHGNVLYNLNYYSRIDTPYSERDIYQHTIQTYLDILVKGEYPFRIYLTNRFSNSPLFRNFSDFNFSYDNNRFGQQIKDQIRRDFLRSLPSSRKLDSLENLLNSYLRKLRGIEGETKNPALIQKMIEARERELSHPASKMDPTPGKDSTLEKELASARADIDEADSLLADKKRETDSLRRKISDLQQLLQSGRKLSQARVDGTLGDIQRAENPAQLKKKMQSLGMSDSSLPKGYQTLMAIRSFSLGRSVVNYSELSAKNISINGVQAEYNPSTYYALASGSVDYRFRDFVLQGPGQSHQYLNVFRIGKGLKNGNSVILTYFTGRRQLYNAATTDSPTVRVPSSSLMGFTLEGNYRITDNIIFTGEVGKSSSPAYTADSSSKSGSASHLFQMNDHSNEAWSMKLNAFFPATQTRIRGSYKHLAANYQSFSIFTDGSSQTAWSGTIDQLFFHRQLDLVLGANTNDFSNPFIGKEYRSTTVFKTIQATLRRRNWPVISLGYFPSSQITKLGNGQYLENLFYTLVGNITQSYSYRNTLMNTAIVYTQFYNRSSDSGFTYFNTRNLLLSQSIFLKKFTFQVNASGAANQDYHLYTLEGKVQHELGKFLTVGAGVKYNKQTAYDIDQLGYSAEATLRIQRLGQVQFSADKGFVPGMNNRLVPDNTGRLSYFKTF